MSETDREKASKVKIESIREYKEGSGDYARHGWTFILSNDCDRDVAVSLVFENRRRDSITDDLKYVNFDRINPGERRERRFESSVSKSIGEHYFQSMDVRYNGKVYNFVKNQCLGSRPSWFGCFVATSAFNSANHPTVTYLRAFRDDKLTQSAVGLKLIDLYNAYGPRLAERLDLYPSCKPSVRTCLRAVVRVLKLIAHFGR